MKLIDLLSVTNEYTLVYIKDLNDNIISCYDGKNSIDDTLNNYDVICQTAKNNDLYIIINLD